MRIIGIGIVAFLCWLAFSNYWYLCRLMNICGTASTTYIEEAQLANPSFEEQKETDEAPRGRKFLSQWLSFDEESGKLRDEDQLSDFVRKLDLGLQGAPPQSKIYLSGPKGAAWARRDFLLRMGFDEKRLKVYPDATKAGPAPPGKNCRIDIYIQP